MSFNSADCESDAQDVSFPARNATEDRAERTKRERGLTEQRQSGKRKRQASGGLAQLGEHLLCTQGVKSSSLLISTIRESGEHLEN